MAKNIRPDRYCNRKRKRDRQFIAQRIDALWAVGGMPLVEYLKPRRQNDIALVNICPKSIGVADVIYIQRNG